MAKRTKAPAARRALHDAEWRLLETRVAELERQVKALEELDPRLVALARRVDDLSGA